MNKILVMGAGGFIGNHLVRKFKSLKYTVVGVDLVYPKYNKSDADEFIIGDLKNQDFINLLFKESFSEAYQLAADMGGAGYIFTGDNDADIMYNSSLINLNVANQLRYSKTKLFFSSSACVYPDYNQMDTNNPICTEISAYPANPDSNYGWEKLFSERLFCSFAKNYNLDIKIARFHNIFGTECTYDGGREKSIAALCRKVIEANDEIEIWGSGEQTRTFLYIDDCLEGILKLMNSKCEKIVNLGSEQLISINQLAKKIMLIENKDLKIINKNGPIGVQGRKSDNSLIESELNWKPSENLDEGLKLTYNWIKKQIDNYD
jgi:GDP-D-mannose 3',5'-epimerase